MKPNDDTTKRFLKAELREKLQRGESRTDLERLRDAPESALREAAATDPDWAGVPPNWFEKAEAVMPRNKVPVSIRIDADVVEALRAMGTGWQTRVNALLRAYVDDAQRR